jgi:hypothetical protein
MYSVRSDVLALHDCADVMMLLLECKCVYTMRDTTCDDTPPLLLVARAQVHTNLSLLVNLRRTVDSVLLSYNTVYTDAIAACIRTSGVPSAGGVGS